MRAWVGAKTIPIAFAARLFCLSMLPLPSANAYDWPRCPRLLLPPFLSVCWSDLALLPPSLFRLAFALVSVCSNGREGGPCARRTHSVCEEGTHIITASTPPLHYTTLLRVTTVTHTILHGSRMPTSTPRVSLRLCAHTHGTSHRIASHRVATAGRVFVPAMRHIYKLLLDVHIIHNTALHTLHTTQCSCRWFLSSVACPVGQMGLSAALYHS